MIIQNGYIRLIGSEETSDDGYLSAPTETLGAKIPCQWITAGMNRVARVGTEAAESVTYTILIERSPLFLTNGRSLLLSDVFGNEIGRFAIKSEEFLDAVGQIKLVV